MLQLQDVIGAPSTQECSNSCQQLGERISLIVDGGVSPRDVASTIIDMSVLDKVTILRQGAIPESELAEFLN